MTPVRLAGWIFVALLVAIMLAPIVVVFLRDRGRRNAALPVPRSRVCRPGEKNLLDQIANEKTGSGRDRDPESIRMVPRRTQ